LKKIPGIEGQETALMKLVLGAEFLVCLSEAVALREG
jgi:hypothetical protein